MLKPLLILNWTLLVATFLSAEFFSINQNYRWAGLIFVFWFLVTELWQVHSLAKGKPRWNLLRVCRGLCCLRRSLGQGLYGLVLLLRDGLAPPYYLSRDQWSCDSRLSADLSG